MDKEKIVLSIDPSSLDIILTMVGLGFFFLIALVIAAIYTDYKQRGALKKIINCADIESAVKVAESALGKGK